MAVRLTVIMIESPPPTAAAGRLAEDIVGHLIGRPGIDMTLVRSLSDLQESSTDRLTLDGITSDVAVLDWQNSQSIVNSLNALGFAGQRSPHSHDALPPPGLVEGRRIYAFDLTQISHVDELIQALNGLKSERQIKTFSIGLGTSNLTPVTRTSVQPTTANIPVPDPPATRSSASEHPQPEPAPIYQSLADIDLDDLIDQLDRSDT